MALAARRAPRRRRGVMGRALHAGRGRGTGFAVLLGCPVFAGLGPRGAVLTGRRPRLGPVLLGRPVLAGLGPRGAVLAGADRISGRYSRGAFSRGSDRYSRGAGADSGRRSRRGEAFDAR